MSVVQQGSNWYVQYRLPNAVGKPAKKEACGKGPAGKQKAKERDAEIKYLKEKGEFNVQRSCNKYFVEVAQEYIDELRIKKMSKAYVSNVARLTNKDWGALFSNKEMDQIVWTDFNPLRKKYAHLSESTAGNYLGMLNAIFNYAEIMDYIPVNPMKKWLGQNKYKSSRRKLTITLNDLGRIVKHAQPHLKFALETLWATGVRPGPSELFKLQWSDVNWESKNIRVRGTKTEGADRIIPLCDDFMDILKQQQQGAKTDYLIEYQGKPIKRKLGKSLAQAVEAAGIKSNVCLYQIRHLFASEMIKVKGDLRAVAGMMGHSSLKMLTEVYYHELEGERRKAIEAKPKLPKL